MALAAGLLVAGAGQAYNGQVQRGWLLLLTSVLLLPWLYSLWDALRTARRITAGGGHQGRGGPVWIVLQAWLLLNIALAVLIALTMTGVLQAIKPGAPGPCSSAPGR